MHGGAELVQLIVTVAFILVTAPFIATAIRLPVSLVEMVGGAVAAGAGLLPSHPIFDGLAEFGFLYLMLLAGMEVNLRELLNFPKKFYWQGGAFLLSLYLLSFLLVQLSHLSSLFYVIFPLISIGLMLSIQQELGRQEWLTLAIRVGVLGELLSIILFTAISAYFQYGIGKELVLTLGVLSGVLLGFWILFKLVRALFWWFPILKHKLMPGGVDRYHQDVRLTIALFFLMIVVLMLLHLDLVLGAFLVGVFIKTFFTHNHHLEEKLAPFGFGVMIPIFFIHVGSTLNLSLLSLKMVKDSLLIVGITILIRYLSSFTFPLDNWTRLKFALSLSMPLTLLIATATVAKTNGFIGDYWYNVLVSTALFEVIVAMIALKLLHWKKGE